MDADVVWVLRWKYGDGSGSGVLRAYVDERRAQEDMEILSDGTTKIYALECVPIFRSESP